MSESSPNENSQPGSGASCVADPNRVLFESVVQLLGPLLDELVFVGGCTTGLFITESAASAIRATKDVDAIVDAASYAKHAVLAESLRRLGFTEDTSPDAPLCRWLHSQLIVDVMPTDAKILGFSNRWYPAAIETAQRLRIAEQTVQIVTPVFFIATKLEAFHGRGGDIIASHDLEDIVAVVDGRPEIVDEVASAAADVRTYIASEIRALLNDADFLEALPGFLRPDRASQARRGLIAERFQSMSAM